MLPIPIILIYSICGLLLLGLIVFVSTGNFGSALVILLLGGVFVFIVMKMGILDISKDPSGGLDVNMYEQAPAPASAIEITPAILEQKEVFYISGNDYTYDEAPAVCAAYGADLATYDQVNTAYSSGAEWCGYGWTQSGMALFPTQQATWNALQQEMSESKRTSCGRPGVNGGYFNPSNKFGVNCYGVKPKDRKPMTYPLPLPGTDGPGFDRMVDKYKSMLSRMSVSAFNRMGWSEWNIPDERGTSEKKHHKKKGGSLA